jgi:hypothetical protein
MQEGETARFLVKGDVRIYDGTMVCLDSNGWAVPGADVAGYKFVGIAQSGIDNRLRPDGDQSIQVRKKGEYDYQSSGPAIDKTNVGDDLFIADDQTPSLSTVNSIKCGKLANVLAGTKNARVEILPVSGAVS